MKLESFFEKFDQFADAPDAVAKMRELILQLAVIGKLCPQDSSEEPASALLAKIAGTNKSRYASGEIRLRENARVSEDLEVSVPDGWSSVALGEIADVNWGNTSLTKKSYSESGFTAYSATGPDGWIDHAEFSGPGIVLSAIGARSGKCFLAEGQWTAIKNTITIIPFSPISNDWLFRAINRESAWKKRGGAQPFIALKDAISLPLLLPPLAEQKRIVAKVDELMALCDRLEAQQQERETRHAALARASLARFADAPTPANLNFLFHKSYAIPPADLRKSILTLAVQGKLVRFEAENNAQTVGDHIEFQNGYAFKSQWFKPDGMRLCRNVNVSHGVVDWRESAFVDDDIAKEFERFALSEGDIVLSLDRPLITTGLKVARIRKSDLPCLLLQRVAKPVPKHDKLDMSYFLLWLNSSEFVDSIDPGRSNGVPHISTRQVQLLPFVLPPLAEQRRIVAKVEQLMALVDALETQLAVSRATAANLLSALVAELTATA